MECAERSVAGGVKMDERSELPAGGELEAGRWILFWVQLLVLAVVAILGAFYAAGAADAADYDCGLGLAIFAILLAFFHIKARFDGAAAGWVGFLLVSELPSLVAVIVIFVALALAGLFVAAGVASGGLHNAGIALFAVSALWILLSVKHVFDALDRGP